MRRRLQWKNEEGVYDNFQEIGSEKFASQEGLWFQFSHFPNAQNDRQKNIIHSFNMFMLCYGVWFHQEWKRFANYIKEFIESQFNLNSVCSYQCL